MRRIGRALSCTVILADDHAGLLAGLEAMLNAEGDMQVVGTAGDGHAAVRQPDVILIDINMPVINGLEALEQMRIQAPASRVLILAMHDDAHYLRQSMAERRVMCSSCLLGKSCSRRTARWDRAA